MSERARESHVCMLSIFNSKILYTAPAFAAFRFLVDALLLLLPVPPPLDGLLLGTYDVFRFPCLSNTTLSTPGRHGFATSQVFHALSRYVTTT